LENLFHGLLNLFRVGFIVEVLVVIARIGVIRIGQNKVGGLDYGVVGLADFEDPVSKGGAAKSNGSSGGGLIFKLDESITNGLGWISRHLDEENGPT